MPFYERQEKIINELLKNESMTVQELSAKLFVSEPTLRRDLVKLEQMKKVIRTHGGAKIIKKEANEHTPFFFREQEQNGAKEIMAKKAVEFIRDGDIIMLDGSTSVYHMLSHLSSFKNLIVITNSAKVSLVLGHMGISNICTGGKMILGSFTYIGEDAEKTAKNYNADTIFFSCRGVSPDGKLTDSSVETNNVLKIMLQNAKKKVFLCDSSKFDRTYLHNLCHISELDEIICEKALPEHLRKMVK